MNRVPTAPHNSYTPNPEGTLSTTACPVDPSSHSPRPVNPFAFARLQQRPSVIVHLWPPLPPQLIVAFQSRSHGHHGNSWELYTVVSTMGVRKLIIIIALTVIPILTTAIFIPSIIATMINTIIIPSPSSSPSPHYHCHCDGTWTVYQAPPLESGLEPCVSHLLPKSVFALPPS
ncbi:Ccr4-Not Transcription Complex Subunit 3 [Manis pentadactyla]|nr:Ccr4-Not Transcription Complex Subunit 3 [Manis pentadactyla]